MRNLVESKLDRYQVAAFKDKSRLAWEVVNEVKECGGRFLKEQFNGLFVEVNDETCRKKVSIAFRDLMKKSRQRQEKVEEAVVPAAEDRKHELVGHLSMSDQNCMTFAHDDDNDEFELFCQHNLEKDTSSVLGFASHENNSNKRHKSFPTIFGF